MRTGRKERLSGAVAGPARDGGPRLSAGPVGVTITPMHSFNRLSAATLAPFMLTASPGHAEVVHAAPDHFTLKIEAVAAASPEVVWERLIHPSRWWSSAHTYSGDAANLTLDLRPGGLWQEAWGGNGVAHGRVIFVDEGRALRLEAPFGPLQGMAVQAVWSITLTPLGDAGQQTTVTFDFVCNGSSASRLDEIAAAVDFVKTEAMTALIGVD